MPKVVSVHNTNKVISLKNKSNFNLLGFSVSILGMEFLPLHAGGTKPLHSPYMDLVV